jgi:hypothetical protein
MKQLQLFLLPMTFCMAFIAYLLQAHMLLSSDVAALMDEGQRMWAGGKYVSDFFETNPPMAMYLYFPVLLFVKMTGGAGIVKFKYLFFEEDSCPKGLHSLLCLGDHAGISLISTAYV